MQFLTFGAIDIGSNAIRLLISDAIEYPNETRFKKVSLIRIPLRLGEDVFVNERVSEPKYQQLLEALVGYRHVMNAYRVLDFRACATSAMREAKNGHELLSEIEEKSGISLEIISGKQEAEIIFNTGVAQMLDAGKNYLYVDVGGGSTEVTVYSKNKKVDSESFNIGTVRMLKERVDDEEVKRYKDYLKEQARVYRDLSIIGSGGNINKLFKLMGKKYGDTISSDELKHIYDYLKRFTFDERISVLRMNPHRADVIIPATKQFIRAMKYSNCNRIYVPKMGLADGIVRLLYHQYKQKYAGKPIDMGVDNITGPSQ